MKQGLVPQYLLEQEVSHALLQELGLEIRVNEKQPLLAALELLIEQMLARDYEKLVYFLYRVDVSESKIRSLLDQAAGENTAALLARAIVDRLQEKVLSRQQYMMQADPEAGELL
ncbi:MAG: hypothetical protein MH132_11060 [Hydrotalea sp.]|jgi:hypothetical protein|nr:hypothetical protein [Hydrotalea sp.]